MSLDEQIALGMKIFLRAIQDKDGYCGCPRCGERDLIDDGTALDNTYIMCITCSYSISGNNAVKTLHRWNRENRSSFQLRIPYPPPH